jgi:hypothetical protein
MCSSKDEYCQQALLSLIEKVPINDSVHHVVTKILSNCVKLSQKVDDSTSLISGVYCDYEYKISENSRMRENLKRTKMNFSIQSPNGSDKWNYFLY